MKTPKGGARRQVSWQANWQDRRADKKEWKFLRDDENYRLRDAQTRTSRARRDRRVEFFSHLLMTATDRRLLAAVTTARFTVNNNHSITARDVHVIRCLP